MATDTSNDTSGFTIAPRDGLEVFLNQGGLITLEQKIMGETAMIVLHPEEAREFVAKMGKFLEEHFPADS